jgi:putative protein-disulfide isomerase
MLGNELIYLGDPMCSWCWGISEVIGQLRAEYRGQMGFRLVLGGLRPGETEPMCKQLAHFLGRHWLDVARVTGQPFNHDILDSRSFVYDTEPPSRAVRAADALDPGLAFPFFQAIQEAFYVHNADTNLLSTYLTLCTRFGLDQAAFEACYNSSEMLAATQEDFRLSTTLGVRSFPSVLVRIETEYHMIAMGYSPFQDLKREIDLLLVAERI